MAEPAGCGGEAPIATGASRGGAGPPAGGRTVGSGSSAARGLRASGVGAERVRDFAEASGEPTETGRPVSAVIAGYGAFARRRHRSRPPAPALVEHARAALERPRAEKARLTWTVSACYGWR